MIKGINIFSGSKDVLGRALTNPTHYNPRNDYATSINRGGLGKYTFLDEGILFNEKKYKDVEEAYFDLKKSGHCNKQNKQLLTLLIEAKLKQYPVLIEDIKERGGVEFLRKSIHTYNNGDDPETFKRDNTLKSWTSNTGDAFIHCLVKAYSKIEENKKIKSII